MWPIQQGAKQPFLRVAGVRAILSGRFHRSVEVMRHCVSVKPNTIYSSFAAGDFRETALILIADRLLA